MRGRKKAPKTKFGSCYEGHQSKCQNCMILAPMAPFLVQFWSRGVFMEGRVHAARTTSMLVCGPTRRVQSGP
jgi:hypothetical protein